MNRDIRERLFRRMWKFEMSGAPVVYREQSPLFVRGQKLAGCADYLDGQYVVTIDPHALPSTVETMLHEIAHCKFGEVQSDVRRHDIKNMPLDKKIWQALIFDFWEKRAEKFVSENAHLWRGNLVD